MEEALGPNNTHTVKALPPTSWHLTTVFGPWPSYAGRSGRAAVWSEVPEGFKGNLIEEAQWP